MRAMIGARPIRVNASSSAYDAVVAALPHYSPEEIGAAFGRGDIVWPVEDARSSHRSVARDDVIHTGDILWAFAPIPDEPASPLTLDIAAKSERFCVIDKPHGLATMPRGSHVAQTVTIAARRQFGNPDIVAAHRLDRDTAGLVLATVAPEWRAPYQEMFARREVTKTYLAVAPIRDDMFPSQRVELHLEKRRGDLRVRVTEGPANALTDIELVTLISRGSEAPTGLYRIHPTTGRMHQIRVTMAHCGIPIVGDPLYGGDTAAASDFGKNPVPLQLLASELEFTDPISGEYVHVKSRRRLELG